MVLRHTRKKKEKGGGGGRKLGDSLNFKNSLALVCESGRLGDSVVWPAGDTPLPLP